MEAHNQLLNFKNILHEEINVADWMEEETKHNVKSAACYLEKLLTMVMGYGEVGHNTPWEASKGKFVFRPAELTIWSGFKGHGKSLAISQVIEKFISDDKKVFIISPEFPPHRVLYRMMVQSLGKSNISETIVFTYLDALRDNLWLYDQQSSLKPMDVVALCRYAVEVHKVDHILIDSLMKCGIAPDDLAGQKRFVDTIQQIAHKTGVHVHLVAHARKGNDDTKIGGLHDISGSSDIANVAENIIFVWRNKQKELGGGKQEEPDCIIKIEAQRNGDGWIGAIPLYFNSETFTFRG